MKLPARFRLFLGAGIFESTKSPLLTTLRAIDYFAVALSSLALPDQPFAVRPLGHYLEGEHLHDLSAMLRTAKKRCFWYLSAKVAAQTKKGTATTKLASTRVHSNEAVVTVTIRRLVIFCS